MGHLSVTERFSTTTSCAEAPEAEQISTLKQRLTNGKVSAVAAEGFPTANGQPLVSAADGEVKVIQNKYHVNLEEYARNFKGDELFGIKFKAPLKWHNVILIFAAHIFCLVCLVTFPLEKLRIPTVLWGK